MNQTAAVITPAQAAVLKALQRVTLECRANATSPTIKRIAEEAGRSTTTTFRILVKLEKAGHVYRHENRQGFCLCDEVGSMLVPVSAIRETLKAHAGKRLTAELAESMALGMVGIGRMAAAS